MTEGLTARQTKILKSIIDEYIETANAVGSQSLDKKFDLGISPATIRNEMVALTRAGYLKQLHTSAGRVPTPLAMKFYINQLMEEKQMSVVDEVKAKEEVWDKKDNIDVLMDEATHALANRTRSFTVGALKDPTSPSGLRGAGKYDRYWQAGHNYIFLNPEFQDVAKCASLFSIFESMDRLEKLFFGFSSSSPLDILFGEELSQWPELAPTSIISTHFDIKGKPGTLSIIGPARVDYSTAIPILRYFGNLIQEVANA